MLAVWIATVFVVFIAGVFANDEVCHDGECYPRIFIPGEEFKAVREGQEIPAGLHIRINMQAPR